MGCLEGKKGAWGYVEGGMGAVSQAICNCAMDHGADVFVDKVIKEERFWISNDTLCLDWLQLICEICTHKNAECRIKGNYWKKDHIPVLSQME